MRVDQNAFYADLFSNPGPAPHDRPAPPRLKPLPAALQHHRPDAEPAPKAVARPEPAGDAAPGAPGADEATDPVQAPAAPRSLVRQLIGDVDVHHLTPRQMADLSLDLYAAGVVDFDDYSALAFQPELHPDFDRTIGALTGEQPQPDRPRDYVRVWNERADFQRRHDTGRPDLLAQSERIAQLLGRIETPTNVVA